MSTLETPLRGAAVRDAVLASARELFDAHGIRAVSADRVIAAAGISKVTFYRHFPSKDDLVVAYLEEELERVHAALRRRDGAPATVDEAAAMIADELCRPGFRGCPFINAAAEYADPDHPVRAVVARFREWMTDVIAAWLGTQGVQDRAVAEQIMMLRDGALVAGYLDGDPAMVAQRLAAGMTMLVGGGR